MFFEHKKSHQEKPKSRFLRPLLIIFTILCLTVGFYILLLIVTPNIPYLYPVERINAEELPSPKQAQLYIPKIGISVPFAEGGSEALEHGAWHRFPERGDPVKGGNFILSAHRFSMALTPSEIRNKSPFYHVDKLAVGDQLIVDYKGVRYGYEVTEKSTVKPTQTEIEAESEEPRLTLYTCTLGGESDGREVFTAKLLGEVQTDSTEL